MLTAVILAGGKGTRLRSVISDVPKPMAPVNGRPFLEHQMDYWIGQGIGRFIISVGYKKEAIINHFGSVYRDKPIKYAIEETPLGTGGGLLNAVEDLSDDFLLLNGDTYFEVELELLLEFHYEKKSDWTLSLFQTSDALRYMPVDINQEGIVASLEAASKSQRQLANGGVYLINPSVLIPYKENKRTYCSLEDDLIRKVIKDGNKVYGKECSGRFIDIGIPDDYFESAKILNHE